MSLTKVTYSMINGAPLNVLDFGAKGDGSTDDTAAIQACLNSFTQATGGGTVVFPPGTYIISASLIVDVNGMTLVGTKGSTWIKRKNGVAADTMNNLQTAYQGRYSGTPIYDLSIIGMGFDGNKANNTVGVNDNFDEGVSLLYSNRTYMADCIVQNVLRIGIALSTGASDSLITGCSVNDCDEGGIYAEVSSNIKFIGNNIKNSSTAAYNIGNICFDQVTSGTISANNVSGGQDGIYIRNASTDVNVSGNTVTSQARYGIWVYDESQGVTPATPKRIGIDNNSISSCSNYPIYCLYANNVIVSNNTIDAAGTITGIFFNNNANISILGNNIQNTSTVASPATTGTIAAGSNSLTIASALNFPNASNGSYVYLNGAGVNGSILLAKIISGGGTTTLTLDRFAQTSITNNSVNGLTITQGAGNSNVQISGLTGTFSPVAFGLTTAGTFVGTSYGTWTMVNDRVLFTALVTQTTDTGGVGQAAITLPLQINATANETYPIVCSNTTYTGNAVATSAYNAAVSAGYSVAKLSVVNGGTQTSLTIPTGSATYFISGQYQFA